MAQTFKEIIEKIDEHLKKSGKRYYSEFCIGISENARKSLFEIHHVDKDNSWWIYVTAVSVNDAEKVEKYYSELGMRRGSGATNESSKMVYCYVVTPTTTE